MASKNINGDLDQINMSFTLTDDSESILGGSDDQSIPQANFQQYISGAHHFLPKQQLDFGQYNQNQEIKKHHSSQMTFGKTLPISQEICGGNTQLITMNGNANKSQFKNYKQYIVSKEKIQEDQKNISKKPLQAQNIESNYQHGQTHSQKSSNSDTIIGGKLERNTIRGIHQNQLMPSSNMNNVSSSNLRSSTTHDETQNSNVMTCHTEKNQTETEEFMKKQLIIVKQENERLNNTLKEKDEIIFEMKKNLSGMREGLTIRDYEQTISKQAIELIQLKQSSEQIQKENKQLQQEIVKNKAESFQKYEDLKQNNEELLEAYEEKFQCQLKITTDNFIKQMNEQKSQNEQDKQILNNQYSQNQNLLNRISVLEKENQKYQVENDQLKQQNEKYQMITKFLDAQQQQYLYTLSKNLSQNFLNSSQQEQQIAYKIDKNNIKANSNNSKNINNNFTYIQPTNIIQQQQQAETGNILISDLQKILQKQGNDNLKQSEQNIDQNKNNQVSDVNLSFSSQQAMKPQVQSPQQKTEIIEQGTELNKGNSVVNKLSVKQDKQQQSSQLQKLQEICEQKISDSKNQSNQNKIQVNESSNQNKSDEQNSQDQEGSFITKSQRLEQKQFQLELGQAMGNLQQQQYSYSTQVTKRNHYLQQNISHRHYPSQLHLNNNLSHTKSCERYGSPLSNRSHQQPIKQKGVNQSQLQQSFQNISASKQQPVQKKNQSKKMNSSNSGILDAHLFQHETIKGYLSPSIQCSQNQRDKDNRNQNKFIQAKKKKGVYSQEQRSFYNSINKSINSNSLLIPSMNKTTVNDSNLQIKNRQHKNQSVKSKNSLNQNEQTIQGQLQDTISQEKFQQQMEDQRNQINSQSIKNLQKIAKSMSNQQLLHSQSNISIQNISKLNLAQQQISSARGIPQSQQNTNSQQQQSQDNQDTFSPRVHTSRSTTTNTKNSQTTQNMSQSKQQERHLINQQSDIIIESPDVQRQERSQSNSTFKQSCSDWDEQCIIKSQNKTQTSSFQVNSNQQIQNKQTNQLNKANVYSKIKNQIIVQQQKNNQIKPDQNNSKIVQI